MVQGMFFVWLHHSDFMWNKNDVLRGSYIDLLNISLFYLIFFLDFKNFSLLCWTWLEISFHSLNTKKVKKNHVEFSLLHLHYPVSTATLFNYMTLKKCIVSRWWCKRQKYNHYLSSPFTRNDNNDDDAV